MSKFEQVAAFIAVIEENGFAAAARKQGVSTVAISRQVARLEADLKAELIKRTTRKVALTEIGVQYYQHAKNALNELHEAQLAIVGSQTDAIGILNVISSRYFAIEFLIPRLSEFIEQNPKLQLKIELAERFPNLAQENIDLIFGVSMIDTPELVRRRVTTTRYVFCASPDYLKKNGTPKTPADLMKHRYIAHSMRNPEPEIYVEPILWLNDSRAMCLCALQGMGIVKLHNYIVADDLASGRLIEILPEFCASEQVVYLYYQQSRYLQPKIRRFIDFYMAIS